MDITLDKTSGKGNATVSLSALINNTETISKTYKITSGGGLEKMVTVEQPKFKATSFWTNELPTLVTEGSIIVNSGLLRVRAVGVERSGQFMVGNSVTGGNVYYTFVTSQENMNVPLTNVLGIELTFPPNLQEITEDFKRVLHFTFDGHTHELHLRRDSDSKVSKKIITDGEIVTSNSFSLSKGSILCKFGLLIGRSTIQMISPIGGTNITRTRIADIPGGLNKLSDLAIVNNLVFTIPQGAKGSGSTLPICAFRFATSDTETT